MTNPLPFLLVETRGLEPPTSRVRFYGRGSVRRLPNYLNGKDMRSCVPGTACPLFRISRILRTKTTTKTTTNPPARPQCSDGLGLVTIRVGQGRSGAHRLASRPPRPRPLRPCRPSRGSRPRTRPGGSARPGPPRDTATAIPTVRVPWRRAVSWKFLWFHAHSAVPAEHDLGRRLGSDRVYAAPATLSRTLSVRPCCSKRMLPRPAADAQLGIVDGSHLSVVSLKGPRKMRLPLWSGLGWNSILSSFPSALKVRSPRFSLLKGISNSCHSGLTGNTAV